MEISELIDDVIEKEGTTFTDHPADRGGPTKFGITADTLLSWMVRNLSREMAAEIYEHLYYKEPKINHLPDKVIPVVFDSAVNHGPSQAIKWLQRAVGVKDDGIIGPVTIRAASTATDVVEKIVSSRKHFYRRLVDRDVSQQAFLAGWLRRADSFLST